MATMNHAAVNMVGKYLFSILLGVYVGVGHVGDSMFNFGGTAKPFSAMAAPFYIPVSRARRFQFLHTLITRDVLKCNIDHGR